MSLSTQARAYKMSAYHVTEKVPIRKLVETFGEQVVEHSPTDLTVRLADDSYLMAYNFGSVAFFNVPEEQSKQILERLADVCSRLVGDMTSDDFQVMVGPALTNQVTFDRAELSEVALPQIQLLALLLAHSATLEFYEGVVENLLDQAEAVTGTMKTSGRLPGYSRKTIQFIGISLSTRRDLISHLYIMDEPESTWQDMVLDRIFTQMKATLEIDLRYRALEYKLKLIQEGVEIIVDLTNAKRNIILEITIVVLILVEILLALLTLHR